MVNAYLKILSRKANNCYPLSCNHYIYWSTLPVHTPFWMMIFFSARNCRCWFLFVFWHNLRDCFALINRKKGIVDVLTGVSSGGRGGRNSACGRGSPIFAPRWCIHWNMCSCLCRSASIFASNAILCLLSSSSSAYKISPQCYNGNQRYVRNNERRIKE